MQSGAATGDRAAAAVDGEREPERQAEERRATGPHGRESLSQRLSSSVRTTQVRLGNAKAPAAKTFAPLGVS